MRSYSGALQGNSPSWLIVPPPAERHSLRRKPARLENWLCGGGEGGCSTLGGGRGETHIHELLALAKTLTPIAKGKLVFPMASHWVYKLHLRSGPMLSNKHPTQNKLSSIFVGFSLYYIVLLGDFLILLVFCMYIFKLAYYLCFNQ